MMGIPELQTIRSAMAEATVVLSTTFPMTVNRAVLAVMMVVIFSCRALMTWKMRFDPHVQSESNRLSKLLGGQRHFYTY